MGKFNKFIQKSLGSELTTLSLLSIALFLFLIVYFLFIGIKYTPYEINELDSLGQHIPLAKSILEGRLFNPPEMGKGLGFYMPVGEIILSLLILLNIPLGFYNIIAVILIYFLCFKLARSYLLSKENALLFSTVVVYLNPIVRLISTQKNDLFLLSFFLLFWFLLKLGGSSLKYFITLGISFGLLIGTKYSGIIFSIVLLIAFGKSLLKTMTNKNFTSFAIFAFLFGGIWYTRNYVLTGNPIYPVGLFGFKGHPEFIIPTGLDTLFNKSTFPITLDAFISEYLIWIFIPIMVIWLFVLRKTRRLAVNNLPLLLISAGASFAYFLGPSEFIRVNITSNMRFLLETFVSLVLFIFLAFKNHNLEKYLKLLAILSVFAIIPQLDYYPKLIILWIGIIAFIVFIMNKKVKLE